MQNIIFGIVNSCPFSKSTVTARSALDMIQQRLCLTIPACVLRLLIMHIGSPLLKQIRNLVTQETSNLMQNNIFVDWFSGSSVSIDVKVRLWPKSYFDGTASALKEWSHSLLLINNLSHKYTVYLMDNYLLIVYLEDRTSLYPYEIL